MYGAHAPRAGRVAAQLQQTLNELEQHDLFGFVCNGAQRLCCRNARARAVRDTCCVGFFFVCATLAVARRRERESVWRVASEIARVAREQGRVGALRGALARDGERATLRLRIRRGRHRRLVDAGVCDCQREKSPSACVASSALFAVTVVLRSFVLYLMLSMIRTPNDPIHKREGFM